MKLVDTIVLSLAVALFIIGVHQTFTVGVAASYWIFMFSAALILYFKSRKNKASREQSAQAPGGTPTRKAGHKVVEKIYSASADPSSKSSAAGKTRSSSRK